MSMLNLINTPWLPVIRADGHHHRIAPWQIAETDNPVQEIAAPRPDFQGALYQFLIGLLQTACAPEDLEEWQEHWDRPPAAEQLRARLAPLAPAFELVNPEGPAFMQDFDLEDGESKPIAALLIEAPGGKTLKDNLDHFVKGGSVEGVCPGCAATALFTLQANAPSGGVGHRVSLRGGGPLTTLVMPARIDATLWHKLWLNILPDETTGVAGFDDPAVLPWVGQTRCSDKNGHNTQPEDVSPLQAYWGMPRRIRLEAAEQQPGQCALCGAEDVTLIRQFRARNYGTNYEGPWVHPLTPYRFDLKNSAPPLSLKGQQNGLGYRHWLGLVWHDESTGDRAAKIVRHYQDHKAGALGTTARLWCFGFDMDNMKARCWYEYQMPILAIPPGQQAWLLGFVGQLLDAAKAVAKLLREQVKAAWFERTKDARGDMSMVDQSFWQATEEAFYRQLLTLAEQPEDSRYLPATVAADWLATLRSSAYRLFDSWALEGDLEAMDLKRITRARRGLATKLGGTKSLKPLNDLEQIAKADAAAMEAP